MFTAPLTSTGFLRGKMSKVLSLCLLFLCAAGMARAQALQRATTVVQPILDESILVVTDKPVYFPDDTLHLSIQRDDSTARRSIIPVVVMEGLTLKPVGQDAYVAVIPQTVTPGSYRILLKIVDASGRRLVYETGRAVEIEEYQAVEQPGRFVRVAPFGGSSDPRTPETIDGEQARNLQVVFLRDSIGLRMGPQFVTIHTVVQLRDGSISPTLERRVVTFRSHGDPERDRSMFVQYRAAYGAFAAISPEELERVRLPLDSLPAWATLKVSVEPDFTIRIGAREGSSSFTRYFRVRGPSLELGFSLGVPKVLFDTQSGDTVEYGNTSAMLRLYYVNGESGNRFPVSFGMGTFGVSSPIDVGVGRGGFAFSTFLDLVELTRIRNLGFVKNVNAGVELTFFLPVERKGRFLINAQVGVSP
jgi:hypothetical protein